LNLRDVIFSPEWEYVNHEADLKYRIGAISGQLIYISMHGELKSSKDIDKAGSLLEKVSLENGLTEIPFIVVDYSELSAISSIRLRQQFAKEAKRVNEITNNTEAIQIAINPDRTNRMAIKLFAPFLKQKIVIVDSVDEAFNKICAISEDNNTDKDKKGILVSTEDMEELGNVFGSIHWGDTEGEISVSPDNPLAFLAETLELVRADLNEMMKKEVRMNEERIKESLEEIERRKKVEKELLEEKEKLDHILNITGTHIDIVDSEYNLHFVDKDWQKIYGNPKGRKCYEYFNGIDKPCEGCGIPLAIETKQVTVTEEILPLENNRIFEVHIIPFQDAAGKWLVAEFNVDITQRKRAENMHQSLLNVLKNSHDFIGVASKREEAFFVNPAGQAMVGLESDDAVSRTTIEEYFLEDDLPYFKEKILPALFSEGRWSGEFRFRHFKTGEAVPVLYDLFLTEDSETGQLTNITTISRDITEHKRAREKLAQSERTYKDLFNSINDSLFIHEIATGAILDVNDSMLKNFGYDRDDIPNLTIADLSVQETPYTNEYANELIKRASKGESLVFEWLNLKKNGEPFYSENILKRVNIGGIERIIAVVKDITHQKKTEEEKEKLAMQLAQSQKMESIGRLAGGVAHDFNNMLGVILGQTELAFLKLNKNESIHHQLDEIKKAAERSADLTKQLLAFARKQTISPKILNLNTVIKDMSVMLDRLIGENIELVWRQAPDLWSVKVDSSQIDQIMTNLCVNAKDAIADTGTVIIETSNAKLDNGDFVQITVSDDGCGMDSETVSHLFEPFFTTKKVGEGTGLGLATIDGIVKQNKGFINVTSELGKGSSFSVFFPRFSENTKIVADKDEKYYKPSKNRSGTVLLVEDEKMLLDMTKDMLEGLGYNVLAAHTPGEAIRIAYEHIGAIDSLLTDVIMPEMNGRDLAKNLLKINPDMKRIFMSGYTADVIAHHGVLDEGVLFIQKPFSLKKLAEKLEEAFK
jgi:two-component system, cell cycle sensor histidine kinase and response regulator CckA